VNRLKFVLQSRGLLNSVERAGQVAERFGLTASRMKRRLLDYAGLAAEFGSRPSLPITARVLARNPAVAHALVSCGVEICVHGLVHNDLSKLSDEAQYQQISQACGIFRDHGVPYSGFRSPYLRYNRATLAAVDRAGFTYDSNLAFYWEPSVSLGRLEPRRADGLERGLRFYNPATRATDRSLPRMDGRLVEIPVSLPDDEMLLDRMGLEPARVGDVWMEMLRASQEQGELLTLQLHPERLSILREPLRRVLAEAASSGTMLATLGEVAAWWLKRAACRLAVDPAGPGVFRVSAPADPEAEVSLVDGGTRAAVLALPATVNCPRKPVVGLAPDVPDHLAAWIKQEGYCIEVSADRGAYGVYVDSAVDTSRLGQVLARCEHPLLRLGFWPRPYRAALVVSGDIDCLTLGDFLRRFTEG